MKFFAKFKKNRGVTLIEMLVALAIFAIMTAIVVYNYGAFNSNINVTNLAYEVSLAIRQAQVYGLSVRGAATYPYGIHFESSSNYFFIFADKGGSSSGDYVWNEASGDTKIEEYELRGDVRVSGLVADGGSPSYLDIVFRRPDPRAYINNDKSTATIIIKSAKTGKEKRISIERSGLISVDPN